MAISSKTLVQLNAGFAFSNETGPVHLTEYHGLRAPVEKIARTLMVRGVPFAVRYDGPTAQLELRSSSESENVEVLSGHWEIDGRPEMVSIFQHPRFLSLPTTARAAIQQLQNNAIKFTPEQMAAGKTLDEIGLVTLTGDGLTFYTLTYNGQTHYSRIGYAARHHMVASSARQTEFSGANVGRVYTPAQMQDEVIGYGDGMAAIAADEIRKITAGDAVDGYTWGWLKTAPTVRIAEGARVECSVEYLFDNWPTIFYEPL